jgi:hypothetical protein
MCGHSWTTAQCVGVLKRASGIHHITRTGWKITPGAVVVVVVVLKGGGENRSIALLGVGNGGDHVALLVC